jgi:hypothetical protein
MIGKNPRWVAKNHGHSVQTMLEVYAAWIEGAKESDVEAIRRGPRERFLAADQILDRYHATASSEELDLDGRFMHSRIVPDTFNGTQDVQWSKRRLEVEVVDFNAGFGLSRKDNRWGVFRCVGFRSPNATRSFDTLSGVSSAHTSKSRVTSVEPCNMPAKPPTKATLASEGDRLIVSSGVHTRRRAASRSRCSNASTKRSSSASVIPIARPVCRQRATADSTWLRMRRASVSCMRQ